MPDELAALRDLTAVMGQDGASERLGPANWTPPRRSSWITSTMKESCSWTSSSTRASTPLPCSMARSC